MSAESFVRWCRGWAHLVLAEPERFSADEWYEAMAFVLAERAPA